MDKRGENMQAEILSIMRTEKSAHSAYDLLDELREKYSKIAPPTVYRALAALIERGQVHRLESLNAYIACQCEDHHQPSIFTICNDCGIVEENFEPSVFSKLSSALQNSGFLVQRHVVEVNGTCASCTPVEATL